MQIFAGVDIGGTTTRVGVLGDKYISSSFRTPKRPQELIDSIAGSLISLCDGHEPVCVGVGCPGAVDAQGVVRFMPNLDFGSFDPAAMLKSKIRSKVVVTNDANAAALGECCLSGVSDAVMLTLGTGVGGGIILGGRIYEGPMGEAAELGHMIICANGRTCGCGNKGCLEAYASGTALIAETIKAMKAHQDSVMWELCPDPREADGRLVFEAEKLGDKVAAEVIKEYVQYLGIGIINICNIFRPCAVIIGGGIGNQGENLLSRLRTYCESCDYGYKNAPRPQILRARLGDNAGLYGAIEMAKYKYKENL